MTEWQKTLREAGYPENVLVLDYETFFSKEYSLKKLSTIEYIQHDKYEELGIACLGMSSKFPYKESVSNFWHDAEAHVRWLQNKYGKNLDNCTVVAHNARFDGSVLAYRHDIRPPYFIDTLGLARHVAARKKNDLASLCERYSLKAKGDTKQFEGLRWGAMTEKQQVALSKYANNDAEREWELFCILLPMLTRPNVELRLIQHTLTLFTRPLFRFDFQKADEIVAEMQGEEAKVLDATGHDRAEISGINSFERLIREALDPDDKLPGLEAEYKDYCVGGMEEVEVPTGSGFGDWDEVSSSIKLRRRRAAFLKDEIARRKPPMRQGKKKLLLAVAKTDPGREILLNHEKPEVRSLMEAKVAIKTWPQHQKRVASMARQAKACDGYLAAPLRYYGAHTGRWSADEAINLQNLTARSPHTCINAIRSLLTAPEGHVLMITDLAQVEARNLAWQAGQDDLVRAFAEGRDVYCEFASEVMGKKIRKSRPIDPPQVAKYLTHYRMLGKVGVLGAGYGMGVDRCLMYARDVYHINIDRTMAERIIKHYRNKNRAICRFWRDIEQAFKYVVRYPSETCEMAHGLTFRNENDTVILGLPSGRALYYHQPRITKDGKYEQLSMPDERKPGARIYMWGGYLTENVVQATSRDILGDSILDLEERGWPCALHSHDEVVLVVPEDQGEKALADSIQVMSTTPSWMIGCPLAAEGKIVKAYCK